MLCFWQKREEKSLLIMLSSIVSAKTDVVKYKCECEIIQFLLQTNIPLLFLSYLIVFNVIFVSIFHFYLTSVAVYA